MPFFNYLDRILNKIEESITLSKVTVYYFKTYKIIKDEMILPKGMTTLEKIYEIGGFPLMETAKEVDTSSLDPDGFYGVKK